MQKLNILIKSFDIYYINKSVEKINDILILLNLSSIKIFTLPKHLQKITLIKSPHIDKKSREQFEWKQYKRRIVIFTADLSFYLELLSILKRMVLPGASIQIFLKFKTFFPFAAKQSLAAPTK